MGGLYDPLKLSYYIFYINDTHMYRSAVTKRLPYLKFKQIPDNNIQKAETALIS